MKRTRKTTISKAKEELWGAWLMRERRFCSSWVCGVRERLDWNHCKR